MRWKAEGETARVAPCSPPPSGGSRFESSQLDRPASHTRFGPKLLICARTKVRLGSKISSVFPSTRMQDQELVVSGIPCTPYDLGHVAWFPRAVVSSACPLEASRLHWYHWCFQVVLALMKKLVTPDCTPRITRRSIMLPATRMILG